MLEIMMDELKQATRDFYNMTGIKIVLYDASRRVLHSYPDTMCSFCMAVRQNDELISRCIEFDNIGFDACEKTRKPYIYTCHMGLCEAITPIIEEDNIIGYMMMGQILRQDNEPCVQRAMHVAAREYGIDVKLFNQGLSELRCVDDDFICSALNIMSMCVCYLHTNKIIRRGGQNIGERLSAYVENHLYDSITVSSLCRGLYISKSKLYYISKQTFGMGITDYIRHARINRAKILLETTNKPIMSIASTVGFCDANYFSRSFKSEVGMTPKEFRKLKNAKTAAEINEK